VCSCGACFRILNTLDGANVAGVKLAPSPVPLFRNVLHYSSYIYLFLILSEFVAKFLFRHIKVLNKVLNAIWPLGMTNKNVVGRGTGDGAFARKPKRGPASFPADDLGVCECHIPRTHLTVAPSQLVWVVRSGIEVEAKSFQPGDGGIGSFIMWDWLAFKVLSQDVRRRVS
jgi:hypothetical protein